LNGSWSRLAQKGPVPLSHTFVPLPQLAWQLPFAQTMPAAQLLPQAPQLLLSVASKGQAWPQPPQLSLSVEGSVHAVPQKS
jgi:hypothetical protein